MNKINYLGSTSERLHAKNKPSKLFAYLQTQTHLTELVQQSLATLITPNAAQTCEVVRYANGELIITTANQTLITHLRYLSSTLQAMFKSHQELANLQKISLVHFEPRAFLTV